MTRGLSVPVLVLLGGAGAAGGFCEIAGRRRLDFEGGGEGLEGAGSVVADFLAAVAFFCAGWLWKPGGVGKIVLRGVGGRVIWDRIFVPCW